MQNTLKDLHHFWFGTIEDTEKYTEKKGKQWFQKSSETDKYIKENYLELYQEHASKNFKEEVNANNDEKLGLILLADQVPRHLFRQNAQAHKFDTEAKKLSYKIIQSKQYTEYHSLEKLFIGLPLMHSEELEDQRKIIELLKEAIDSSVPPSKNFLEFALKMSLLHYELIEKFGRFPHRNHYMNRNSTPEEIQILQDPKYHF